MGRAIMLLMMMLLMMMMMTTMLHVVLAQEAPAPDCQTAILGMADCLSYVTPGSNLTKPEKPCCPELKGLVENNPVCLCTLLANSSNSLGIQIDVNKALKLPTVCKVQTPPVSTCALIGIPVGAPLASKAPANSPGVPTPDTDWRIPKPVTGRGIVQPGSKKKAHMWIWIGTAIAAALLVMVLCISSYLLRRKLFLGETNLMIENEMLEWMESDRFTGDVNVLQNDGKPGNNLTVFSYASVVAATTNFSEENKLGQGGFGPVYKGKLVTGREIAVKRLSRCSGQGTLEFKNELILISELQHTNLVQLFGYCIHGKERMLIYAYMPNKSLDYFLFDSTRAMLLDWTKRFNIIEGIAQGLLYLHKYSRMRVIHRDLKASNILLDEYMKPKISDFGLARIFTHNELEASTNRIVGTYGYMSPEYAMEGIFSIKSDVYSFGVLMLEIISGRRNSSFYIADRVLNIVGYAWELWKEGRGLELMDPTLKDSCTEDQLLRCFHVGLLCVEENAADRPSMSDVVSMLTTETISLPLPTRPAFITIRNVIVSDISISRRELQIISVNGLSNTTVAGR